MRRDKKSKSRNPRNRDNEKCVCNYIIHNDNSKGK